MASGGSLSSIAISPLLFLQHRCPQGVVAVPAPALVTHMKVARHTVAAAAAGVRAVRLAAGLVHMRLGLARMAAAAAAAAGTSTVVAGDTIAAAAGAVGDNRRPPVVVAEGALRQGVCMSQWSRARPVAPKD